MKKLIAGNWKMNGSVAGACGLAESVGSGIDKNPELLEYNDFLICPPAAHLFAVKRIIDHNHGQVFMGGQDCSNEENGAHTGDISAEMLKDCGCSHVILGHSERRTDHKETSLFINEKAARAHIHGLVTVICVGETLEEREAGNEFSVVEKQLNESIPDGASAENTVIAYEPVWAIGTGKSATPEDVEAMHRFIREKLQEKLEDFAHIRILYGGSVKPDNARALFEIENVDGALIGGASLKADQFLGIAGEAVRKKAA